MVNRMNSDLSRTGAVERDIEQVFMYRHNLFAAYRSSISAYHLS